MPAVSMKGISVTRFNPLSGLSQEQSCELRLQNKKVIRMQLEPQNNTSVEFNFLFAFTPPWFYLRDLPLSSEIRYAYHFDLIAAFSVCSYNSQLHAKMGANVV
jgi:hypothetical protein